LSAAEEAFAALFEAASENLAGDILNVRLENRGIKLLASIDVAGRWCLDRMRRIEDELDGMSD
jgi:hypothetical protein